MDPYPNPMSNEEAAEVVLSWFNQVQALEEAWGDLETDDQWSGTSESDTAPEVRRYMDVTTVEYSDSVEILPVEEYRPRGRYIDFTAHDEDPSLSDFYHINGIPHEVSTPNGEWIPFKRWILSVARYWSRFVDQPNLSGMNPDCFGDIYDRGGLINFVSVARARLKRNVRYALWTNIAWSCFEHSLNVTSTMFPAQIRLHTICFALFYHEYDHPRSLQRIREFIASKPVKKCFTEFVSDYLLEHTEETNSFWNVIQPRLGETPMNTLRAKYGSYATNGALLNKVGWNREDHACRFILAVHDALGIYLSRANVRPSAARAFERYAFSGGYFLDVKDKHWFGWSLLTFLTMSWHHNQEFPVPTYDEVLAPVLYDDWEALKLVFYPEPKVGMIDLNPDSKWDTDEYPNEVNLRPAVMEGIISMANEDALDDPQYESDTDLHR
ncbi:hypothetical protein F4818DRAFT_154924 [Hypoxylon cercidicola]|nr:hypothetical protein F4818DRAFT_154924 [Hypoxylon cercidicola]